jgi:hypothetical protein
LPQCFKDHAEGKRHEFEHLSEQSEGRPEPKERVDYVEEDDYTTLDMTKKECDTVIAGLLPTGSDMPEVDAYDEELKKQGVLVVRDEHGKFLKGQQLVRKPKKIYANSMPKFSCDTCIKAQDCPKYKPGYVCAFDKMFKKFNTRNRADVLDAMYSIVDTNIARMQRMMAFENMDTGIVDPAVTQLMDMNMKYLTLIQNMEVMGNRLVAQRRVVVDETGKTETVETVTGNPQGGILAQIFGGVLNKEKAEEEEDKEIVDITPEKE